MLLVKCGRLIDGTSDEPLRDVTLLIDGERVVGMVATAALDAIVEQLTRSGAVSAVLDVSHSDLTVLPGLIDANVHLCDNVQWGDTTAHLRSDLGDLLENGRKNAQSTINAGVTSVRDGGSFLAFANTQLRDEIAAGRVVGPRVQASGFYLSVAVGDDDKRVGACSSPEQFAQAAEQAVAGGANFLKIIASGALLCHGGKTAPRDMTPEEIAAVVRVAHAHSLRVSAHALTAESVRHCLDARCDVIDHAALCTDAELHAAREARATFAMDLYQSDFVATQEHWPAEFLDAHKQASVSQRDAFRCSLALGCAHVFASEAAVYPHGEQWRQFLLMTKLGMTPMQAIKSATSGAAAALGWSRDVGSLHVGAFADVVVVHGDPLDDISQLERVAWVLKGGVVLKHGDPSLFSRPGARPTHSDLELLGSGFGSASASPSPAPSPLHSRAPSSAVGDMFSMSPVVSSAIPLVALSEPLAVTSSTTPLAAADSAGVAASVTGSSPSDATTFVFEPLSPTPAASPAASPATPVPVPVPVPVPESESDAENVVIQFSTPPVSSSASPSLAEHVLSSAEAPASPAPPSSAALTIGEEDFAFAPSPVPPEPKVHVAQSSQPPVFPVLPAVSPRTPFDNDDNDDDDDFGSFSSTLATATAGAAAPPLAAPVPSAVSVPTDMPPTPFPDDDDDFGDFGTFAAPAPAAASVPTAGSAPAPGFSSVSAPVLSGGFAAFGAAPSAPRLVAREASATEVVHLFGAAFASPVALPASVALPPLGSSCSGTGAAQGDVAAAAARWKATDVYAAYVRAAKVV